jgi:carbamoyl-phosphate synthase large subunit
LKTILVSGASGIVGYGILRSLRKSGEAIQLIGTTIYNDSVAQGFCDKFELAPPTNDAGYMEWLFGVIKKYDVDLIIPGIEVDMYKWAESISEIKNTGIKVLINNIDLISLCRDKWLFYEKFNQFNTPWAIETSLISDFDILAQKFNIPFLLKPRSGYGSKGIVKIDNSEAFSKYKSEIGSILMAQPIVGNVDEEFTTSSFCDGAGGIFASMTLRRKLSKDGFTEKAEVVMLDNINDVLSTLCGYFKPIGPTNFQFRMHNGQLKLLEINPRISSSTSIRTAFGYNECLMAVEYFLDGKKPQQPAIRQGRAVRYMEDFIFYEDRINL